MVANKTFEIDELPLRYRRFIGSAYTARGYGVTLVLRYGVRILTTDILANERLCRNRNWTVLAQEGGAKIASPIIYRAHYRHGVGYDNHLLVIDRVSGKKPSLSDVQLCLQFANFALCFCDRCTTGLNRSWSDEAPPIPVRGSTTGIPVDLYRLRAQVGEANEIDLYAQDAAARIDAILNAPPEPVEPEPVAPVEVAPEPVFDLYGIGIDVDPEFARAA
jgi:hypothetical protein